MSDPALEEKPLEAVAPGGHPMEIYISYVLRIGVMTAGAIILIGLLWFVIGGPPASGPNHLSDVIGNGGHSISVSINSVLSGVAHGNSVAIIQLGVLVLILTPLMRVAMTVFLFTALRDHIFTVITLIVLVVLIMGLIGVGS